MAIKPKSSSLSRHRFERSERVKTRPALAFGVKKLVGMTLFRGFTTRFEEEDETDKSDKAKELSETSSEEEQVNDSDH
ncbi:hypothetical protein E4U59_006547 [Claviceps monticola]|nr:hypothetical protein E4U59_006547 [Claviceps monticola]